MGMRPAVFIALPLLLATPSLAQEQGGGDPVFNLPRTSQPPSDPTRQGPELDVFRGAPVTPPASTPVITPPPPVVAQPQPQPATPAQPQRPVTASPRPAPAEPAPSARAPEGSSTAPQPSAQQPPATQPLSPQPAPAEPAAPQAAPAPTPTAPANEPPLSPPDASSSSLGWIAGAIALLAAALVAAWLFLRRRPEEAQQPYEEPEAAPPPPAVKPVPAPPASHPAAARPVPVPPAPQPKAPAPAPAPAATTAERPWIDLTLEVRSARLSLMGATIGYTLTLHNRGQRGADDILVRTFIANADVNQQAQLQQFFAGAVGLPAHSAVSLAPGQGHSLTGELRLLPDQIAPVQMGDRALLIPLIAFDAQYRWSDEPDAAPVGSGRTGRAFIVGQEKTPPADRLAPFRLDQGPRQFRTPGSRATALELAS